MKKVGLLMGLGLVIFGSGLLLTHSSIQDVGIVVLFVGTLFTIWHKLGILEERISNICKRLEEQGSRIRELEDLAGGGKCWDSK